MYSLLNSYSFIFIFIYVFIIFFILNLIVYLTLLKNTILKMVSLYLNLLLMLQGIILIVSLNDLILLNEDLMFVSSIFQNIKRK